MTRTWLPVWVDLVEGRGERLRAAFMTWAAQNWILAASPRPTTRIGGGLPRQTAELGTQRSTPVTSISSGKEAGTSRSVLWRRFLRASAVSVWARRE